MKRSGRGSSYDGIPRKTRAMSSFVQLEDSECQQLDIVIRRNNIEFFMGRLNSTHAPQSFASRMFVRSLLNVYYMCVCVYVYTHMHVVASLLPAKKTHFNHRDRLTIVPFEMLFVGLGSRVTNCYANNNMIYTYTYIVLRLMKLDCHVTHLTRIIGLVN